MDVLKSKNANAKGNKIADIPNADTYMTPVCKDPLHVVWFLIVILLTDEHSIILDKISN